LSFCWYRANTTTDYAQSALLRTAFIPVAVALIDPLPTAKLTPVYEINSWAQVEDEKDENLQCLVVASTACYWLLKVLQELHHSTAQAALVENQTLSFRPLANLFLVLQQSESLPAKLDLPELVDTDCGILLVAAELLEAFLLDVEVARKEIGVASIILPLLDFVENRLMPDSWRGSAARQSDWQHIHSAISKGLTAVATEDSVMEACFAAGSEMGQVLQKLEKWLQKSDRDDLLVCSSVMLANLARSGALTGLVNMHV
jgi:hypothetical protein